MSETKVFLAADFKSDSQGRFSATFSTFGVVDKDGDVTTPDAIGDGTPTVISAWNHSSWQGALPVGVGTIHNDGQRAYVTGSFLDTAAGQETLAVVRALGPLGMGRWSYGYTVGDLSTASGDLAQYGPTARRILKQVSVYEVSPVLAATGIGTGTDSVEGASIEADPELASIATRLRDAAEIEEIRTAYRRSLADRMRYAPLTSDELDDLLSA